MTTPEQVIAKLPSGPSGFFAKYSMSRLENVLAGVSLPIAINGLIGSVVVRSIKEQSQKCLNNAVALMDPYLPNAPDILRSATTVSKEIWNMSGVPNPYSQAQKVVDLTIACIGMAQKQGSGMVKLPVPYNWYTYTMNIPRADGTTVTMPMIIAYKVASDYKYWDNVKCFVVCTPSIPLSVVPNDWTTFPNMAEVTNIVWPIPNPQRVVNLNPYRPASQPDLKFVITNVKIKNDKTNPGAVERLVTFANASKFASSNIVNGSLSSTLPLLQLQTNEGIADGRNMNAIPTRAPFTDPQKELLWGIGNACTANTLTRQAAWGDPKCSEEVITLVNDYLANHAPASLSGSTASPTGSTASPTATALSPTSPSVSTPATALSPTSPSVSTPAPAFQLPVSSRGYNAAKNPYKTGTIRGGTKRRSKQSRPHHKKRSRKQRSYKKQSDKRKRH